MSETPQDQARLRIALAELDDAIRRNNEDDRAAAMVGVDSLKAIRAALHAAERVPPPGDEPLKEALEWVRSKLASLAFEGDSDAQRQIANIAGNIDYALTSARSAPEGARAWQPIETLKQIDKPVLMWTPVRRLFEPPFLPNMKPDVRVSTRRNWTWATLWQPLPPPPSAGEE